MELSAEGVAVERGGRLALVAPDFRVRRGEAATLVGPNGSGKSTLLRALAGFSPLKRGDARLGDLSLSEDAEAFAEAAAYAGHLDAVKPALTVRGNLASWAAIYGSSPGRVDAALARFSLDHIAETPAAYCSAGQKRRLGLARLLVVDRSLWLLDEPTVSLDAASSVVFAEAVRDHCAGGGIAVAATHIDLGLPPGPQIELAPPRAEAAAAADPFLAGEWA
ncbi:MAG: heme ABC exporter ATP-binding protein CcmA [Pseudomonadota bacterium]